MVHVGMFINESMLKRDCSYRIILGANQNNTASGKMQQLMERLNNFVGWIMLLAEWTPILNG